jgi:hypothetical protein
MLWCFGNDVGLESDFTRFHDTHCMRAKKPYSDKLAGLIGNWGIVQSGSGATVREEALISVYWRCETEAIHPPHLSQRAHPRNS